MALDLKPETETTLREYARREGVSVDELLARTFPPKSREPSPSVPADDPVLRFLRDRLRGAENATPEEIAEDEAGWQEFKQAMNDTRRAHGERLVYKEDARR